MADVPVNKAQLFVRGIPYSATNAELEEFFSDIGPVRSCFAVADPNAQEQDDEDEDAAPVRRNKGYGFVQYAIPDDAAEAIKELPSRKFKGRTLLIEFAIARTRAEEKSETRKKVKTYIDDAKDSQADKRENPQHVLLVKGIPRKIQHPALRKDFRKFGDIKHLAYPFKQEESPDDTENTRAAALYFETIGYAKRALRLINKAELEGKALTAAYLPPGAQMTQVFVHNLDFRLTAPEFRKHFEPAGSVQSVYFPRSGPSANLHGPEKSDAKSENKVHNSGFGFVQYTIPAEARNAVETLNGTKLRGRVLTVSQTKTVAELAEEKAKGQGNHVRLATSDDDEDESDEESADDSEDDDESIDEEEVSESEPEDEEEFMALDEDEEVELEKENPDVKPSKGKTAIPRDNVDDCTLFVRNLSFDTTDQDLRDKFSAFGKLAYALVTRDKVTGLSRGSGFIRFRKAADAAACLTLAREVETEIAAASAPVQSSVDSTKLPPSYRSVLEPEVPSGATDINAFRLHQHQLTVLPAIARTEVAQVKAERKITQRKQDRRNMYLLMEGLVPEDSALAMTLGKEEMLKRTTSYGQRKAALAANPNFFLSKVRLAIRNLPRSMDDKELRTLGKTAVAKFKEAVRSGATEPLSREEREEGWQYLPRIKQAKVNVNSKEIDKTTGKPKSRGSGFLEFQCHAHALATLRYLNNNPTVFTSQRRPIVEFAMENARLLHSRNHRIERQTSRQKPGENEARPKRGRTDIFTGAPVLKRKTPGDKDGASPATVQPARSHAKSANRGGKDKPSPHKKPRQEKVQSNAKPVPGAASSTVKAPPASKKDGKGKRGAPPTTSTFSATKDLIKNALKAGKV
ncbi:RNA recognition motif-containing protein [Tieghemiomyces parasiticus]|uniref:RNA recognition motif-containing protein n=1 Tax=Tieghemiomyces parasiticus TaxID=78921 RepID=A0A9W8DXZ2_9FUNG|nr:RNA recognition motif-containing protein [Tieghemiomyces parasiticus]